MAEMVMAAMVTVIGAVMVIFLILMAVNIALFVALRSHIPQAPVQTTST
jgi:hypothetical protein